MDRREFLGAPVTGAVRDTALIPRMAAVTIAFDAANPGRCAASGFAT